MALVNLLVLLAIFQFIYFGSRVGAARQKFGVSAPATSGHEIFERYYRIQMNTLEMLIMLIPAVWIASTYWNRLFVAAMLAVYLIGRMIYFSAYVADPKKRGMGFAISILPIAALLVSGVVGALMDIVNSGF